MVIAVASLNVAAEDDPTLTLDQLEVFFNSGRTGTIGATDIWTSTRSSTTATWSMPTNVAILNTAGDDATPEVSRDGLTLFFVANGVAGAKDTYFSTRPTRTAAWATKTHVPALSTASDESGPTLTPDLLTIYFSNNASTDDDLYVSSRAAIGAAWTMPVVMPINSPTANDAEPFINGANTLLLWSSDRGGNFDLWEARRATPADPWGTPQPVSGVNTGTDERDPWLSADEHTLYFVRGNAIVMATR